MPAWLCSIQANAEWCRVSKLFRVISSVYVSHSLHKQHAAHPASFFTLHFHCKFERHKLLNCIDSISFYACVGFIQFLFKISKRDCFKCKSWQAAHLKCFCSSWLLQIQYERAPLWNYLAPCKWTSAIATLPPTRFGVNHWRAVSTCK